MTDEEKAEEYARNVFNPVQYEVTLSTREIQIRIGLAYKHGLVEGRKEEQEKTCYCEHIQHFEKEVAELNKENKELKQHNEELDTFDRSQSYKLLLRIDELKAVIRSMMNEESKYTLDELEKLLEDK